MRFIDISRLEFPDNWEENANGALESLEKFVNRKATIRQLLTIAHDLSLLKELAENIDDDELCVQEIKGLIEQATNDPANLEAIRNRLVGLDKILKVSEEIDRYAEETWRTLKPYLSKIVEGVLPNDDYPEGKCWYCESRYRVRMLEVDHFRPKASIRGDDGYKDDLGYWWLAFNYRNFRLSCQTCNRLEIGSDDVTRGKGTWFPLVDENSRACNTEEISNETPFLLDPTKSEDVALLFFDANGNVGPANSDVNSLDYKRALRSIKIYHLEASNDKRLAKCRHIENIIIDADIAYRTAINLGNTPETRAEQEMLLRRKIETLYECFDIRSEYSRAAEAAAKNQISKFDWVEEVIGETIRI